MHLSKKIMALVVHLVLLANQHGHSFPVVTSGWIARPILIHPRQTNSFDCGVWVITNIAAVLSGFLLTGIQEHEIPVVRHSLLRLLLALPVHD